MLWSWKEDGQCLFRSAEQPDCAIPQTHFKAQGIPFTRLPSSSSFYPFPSPPFLPPFSSLLLLPLPPLPLPLPLLPLHSHFSSPLQVLDEIFQIDLSAIAPAKEYTINLYDIGVLFVLDASKVALLLCLVPSPPPEASPLPLRWIAFLLDDRGRRGHEAKQEGNLGGIQDEKNADVVQVDSVFFCWCDGTQVNLKYFVQHL